MTDNVYPIMPPSPREVRGMSDEQLRETIFMLLKKTAALEGRMSDLESRLGRKGDAA